MDYNSIFYVKRNNKVVACKFERLFFWYNSSAELLYKYEESFPCRVTYTLKLADGTYESGYYDSLPNLSQNIDQCLNDIYVQKPHQLITKKIFKESIGFIPKIERIRDYGFSFARYMAWMWNGFEPVWASIGSMDGDSCRSTCWYNALTRKFENRKWYATREECARDNLIEVINF